MQSENLSNADLIRFVAIENGSHTNKWVKEHLANKHRRIVSTQQIQQVLGTTKERGIKVDKYVKRIAAELVQACGYDNGLAMMVLADMGRFKT
jgi:hypothetical protein